MEEVFAQEMLAADPEDLAPRFTALHFYYKLATDNWAEYSIYNREMSEAAQQGFRSDLRTLVSLLPVEECPHDSRRIKWEISNSLAAEDWDRAHRLLKLAEAFCDPTEAKGLWLLRGHINFFLALEAKEVGHRGENFSMLAANPPDGFPGSPLAFEAYKTALVKAPKKIGPGALGEKKQQLIRDARNDLERALRNGEGIQPSYHAMLGACYFVLDDFAHAAEEYEKVLASEILLKRLDFEKLQCLLKRVDAEPGEGLASLIGRAVEGHSSEVVRDFKPDLLRVLGKAHALAGEPGKAESVYRQWAHEYPDDPRAYENLAEILAQEAKYPEAYEALRRRIDLTPGSELDPAISTAMALGAIAADRLDLDEITRRVLEKQPVVDELVHSLLVELWLTYRKMAGDTQSIWRFAAIQTRYNPLLLPDLAARYRQTGAEKFAKVVEIELRQRIFGKFRTETKGSPGLGSALQLAQKDRQAEVFAKFLTGDGHLTLGQMGFILRAASTGRSGLFKSFREWLRQSSPKLEALRLSDIDVICKPLNAEKHTTESLDVKEVPERCRRFLDALLANAPALSD
jgi:tetratricopeptide (TPR) repeat protein